MFQWLIKLFQKNKKNNEKTGNEFEPVFHVHTLVRSTFPELMANNIVSVQPMSQPVGLVYALRMIYDQAERSLFNLNKVKIQTMTLKDWMIYCYKNFKLFVIQSINNFKCFYNKVMFTRKCSKFGKDIKKSLRKFERNNNTIKKKIQKNHHTEYDI